MSLAAKIEGLTSNTAKKFEYDVDLDSKDMTAICEALQANTSCEEVVIANTGVQDSGAIQFAAVLEKNTTMTKLDLGYNKITAVGVEALALALANNTSVLEVKLHRQEKDMGPAAEEKLCVLWETNVTLTRLYATLHSRKFNGDNTRGEVRNKEIMRRKEAGRDWLDLDPARKEEFLVQQTAARKKAEEEAALTNAPISAKIESTGGPYTYKQLTCAKEFFPDDVITGNKETFLSDEEFATVFGMDKEAFGKLPKWKQNGQKKDKKLH